MSSVGPTGALGPLEPTVPLQGTEAPAGRSRARIRRREVVHALLRSPVFMVGAAILLFWIVDAVLWHAIVPHDPQAVGPNVALQGPSSGHWFGTDDLGRDVFSRVLAGARPVLTVAPAATLIGIVGGTVLGLVTGYYRGIVDDVLMRIVDALLSFPVVITAVLVLSVLGPSQLTLILVIGIIFAPVVARTVRSTVLAERDREYVAAARMRGDTTRYTLFVEILPNVTAPIIVEATIRLGYAIFTMATLSFLGLGLQQPSPDWGLSISLARVFLQVAPWVVVFNALALASLVVAVNLVAEGLRQAFDQ